MIETPYGIGDFIFIFILPIGVVGGSLCLVLFSFLPFLFSFLLFVSSSFLSRIIYLVSQTRLNQTRHRGWRRNTEAQYLPCAPLNLLPRSADPWVHSTQARTLGAASAHQLPQLPSPHWALLVSPGPRAQWHGHLIRGLMVKGRPGRHFV